MRSKVLGMAALALMISGATSIEAQAAPRSVYFWSSAVGQQGLKAGVDNARPGTWGNGSFAETRAMLYENAQTLKITTRNFREGVRFDLKTPLDIEPYRQTGYVRLRVHFKNAAVNAPAAGAQSAGTPAAGAPVAPGGGFGGKSGADGFGNYGNAVMRGNFQLGPLPPLGGMGGLPGVGQMPIVTGPSPQTTPITQLLCTLVLENGIIEGSIDIPKEWKDPTQIDFDKVHPDADGWLLFALPLSQMNATPGASGLLQRVILSGDHEDTFYLTQAALVIENNEMTVSIRKLSDPPGTQNAEITVKPGPLTLVAEVEAGAADPAIEWNFDADNVGNLPPADGDDAPNAVQPVLGGFPAPPAPITGAPKTPAGANPQGGPIVGGGAVLEEPVVGPRIDARGLVAKFTYPDEEQNYRVEVTVRDRSGKKEPVKTSILVHVRG